MKHILLSALGLAAVGAMLWADPPGRVGRLSYVDGTVSFSSAAGQAWETAPLNYPLTSGNQLSTSEGSRAEIQIGSAAVRLSSDTVITFEALDDTTVQVRLDKGLMSVRLRHLGPDQSFQVDTQTASITLAAPGRYRIDQADSGDATIVTRDGNAQVTGGQASFHVYSGQSADMPALDPSGYRISSAPPPDSWDVWMADRDAGEEGAASTRYVSAEMDGAADLDGYGRWIVAAGYGPVWIPGAVPVGWAPYTFGHWVWIDPWGWTWVDYEPWGFAPFHYGRWVLYTGVWCWVPGPILAHPVYAPALVRWVGPVPVRDRPPVLAHATWVPLSPRQQFRPLYPVSTTYLRAVNGSVIYRPRFPTRPGVVAGPAAAIARRPEYMTRVPAGVPAEQARPRGPYSVPWAARPAHPAYPYPGGPAYAGNPGGDHRRRWPAQGQDGQDPWLLRRAER